MRGGTMSSETETLRVRIAPGIRMWQALLVAAVLVGTLVLGLLLGRAAGSASEETTSQRRDSVTAICHIPKRVCQP
jgi:hypothetical protein